MPIIVNKEASILGAFEDGNMIGTRRLSSIVGFGVD